MANMFSGKSGRGSGAKKHAVSSMKKARQDRKRRKRPGKWSNESWKRNSSAKPYWALGGNGSTDKKGADGAKIRSGPATNPGWK